MNELKKNVRHSRIWGICRVYLNLPMYGCILGRLYILMFVWLLLTQSVSHEAQRHARLNVIDTALAALCELIVYSMCYSKPFVLLQGWQTWRCVLILTIALRAYESSSQLYCWCTWISWLAESILGVVLNQQPCHDAGQAQTTTHNRHLRCEQMLLARSCPE